MSSDTRTIAAGALFVALRGERFDGHDFIDAARARGAVAAMVDRRAARGDGDAPLPLLVVDDTRLALGRLAGYWRGGFTLPLIAVTGSQRQDHGEGNDRRDPARALRRSAATLATPGNLNNDIGLPLTLLRLRAQHRAAPWSSSA